MTTETLLTIYEVAEHLRVPVGTVRYLVRTGALAAVVLPGRHVLIERSALEALVKEHRTGAPAEA